MKVLNFGRFLMMAVAVTSFSLTSCSDDDEPNIDEEPNGGGDYSKLTTPAMADEAALYTITDSESPYSSIELTESGRYIVLPNYYVGFAPAKSDITTLAGISPSKSRSADGSYFGKYTKIGEGEYILEGFGALTVTGSSSESCELLITREDGTEVTIGAQQEEALSTDPATLALCRSWKVETIRLRMSVDGEVITDRSATRENYSSISAQIGNDIYNYNKRHGMLDEDDEPSDYEPELPLLAEEVIFTKCGSYLLFADSELATNIWRWKNPKEYEMHYSHDVSDLNNPEYSNNAWLTFKDNTVTTYEYNTETTAVDESGTKTATVKAETWTTLSELK